MNYTVIAGIHISKLTLGTAQLGLEYGIANSNGKPDHRKSNEILKAAVDHGVNCFDTAPLYGDSELIVGSFISSHPSSAKPYIMITKLPPINFNDKYTANGIYDLVRENVVKSLERLRLEKIPIYLLHRASDIDRYGASIIETLLRLKDEGLIGISGVSVYSPQEVERTLETDTMKAIQVPLNIFDQRLIKAGLLNKLKERDYIVFARSIFLQGLFFLNTESLPPNLALAEGPLKRLQELARDQDRGIAELALTFVRDLPGITSLVIGAETVDQVLEDMRLMDSPPLSPRMREEIMNTFSDLPLELVNPSLWNLNS